MGRSKDWLDEANGDLEHARNDMECRFHNWARFSAQQQAEKAIKAVFPRMDTEAWGLSVADLLMVITNLQRFSPKSLQKRD
jgi:HEPN domain-containing protein